MNRRAFVSASAAALSTVSATALTAVEQTAAREHYELRTYSLKPAKQSVLDSYLSKAFIKVEMFNQGELAIFKRVGLTPVLFGSAMAGAQMPNLTYLLVFPDEEGRKASWGRFVKDPEWLKLKAIPGFADKEIVSKITNKVLSPAAYSEL